jgi:hypothetical protein
MKLLKFLDIDFVDNGEDCKIDCPYCSHEAMEISNSPPHQFQCWKCKKTGNGYSLLQHFYEEASPINPRQAKNLQKLKSSLKYKAIKDEGIKAFGDDFLFPVLNAEGSLVTLYKYSTSNNVCYSSPKPFSCTLIGLDRLKAEGTIYIAEGHWDYLALRSHDEEDMNLLGLCGSSFPRKFVSLLEGKDVVWLGDNDDAGETGLQSLASMMIQTSQRANKLQYLDWKKVSLPGMTEIPDKFDIRDLIGILGK